ncbi:MAG: helix-turn-helix domain-containing protein, partial [Pseudomonadota bacterium]
EGSLEDVTRRIGETYFRQLAGHDTTGVYELFVNQMERGLLSVVLEHTRGNQTRAAEILGINRGTLRKKLRSCELL